MKDYKVGWITMEKADNRRAGSVGSSRIRARWVWKYWDQAEEWQIGRRYDAVIFQKVFWDQMLENYDGVKILDMCDPLWLEGRDVFKYVHQVDAVVTATQPLADYISKLAPKKKVLCIPDRMDLEYYSSPKMEQSEKLRKLVWFGYSANFSYIERALRELAKRKLCLTMISESQIVVGNACRGLTAFWRKYDQKTLNDELKHHDAVLLPSNRGAIDDRGKYKSNNKELTAWALNMPVIGTPDDLDRLETKTAREEEVLKNMKKLEDKYDVRTSAEEYDELVVGLLRKRH